VLLTTHDLAEADALADRVVLLHHGRVLAEGTPAEIKAGTASRRVRVVSRLDEAWFRARPGVADVRRDGQAFEVLCAAAEPLVLDVLRADPAASDLEVSGASLEDAFLALTQAASAAARPAVAA
jgi:ABC-2 type transport system ATP-binding protein